MTAVAEPGPSVGSAAQARTRFAASNAASEAFFALESDRIALACHAMAGRFQTGGRLLVHADAARLSDVSHAVVEFMHPVVVGKRALPAIALRDADALRVVGRRGDIVMLLADDALTVVHLELLSHATAMNMLPLVLTGGALRQDPVKPLQYEFSVPSSDACIVQETHEMLYHVLWELVHVFLDHGAVRT
ncbi:SIS domain-containing protein [soil metagenome]